MWPHFVHLFHRILQGMPQLVSSNWAAWILGLILFVLYEALAVYFRGWDDMRRRWKENVGMGLGVTTFGYVLLFAWSIVRTIYDDHHDDVGRWQVVVKEKNDLKEQLSQRDRYIGQLEGRSCSVKKCPENPLTAPLEITTERYGGIPVDNGAKLYFLLGMTNHTISPNVRLTCDRDFQRVGPAILFSRGQPHDETSVQHLRTEQIDKRTYEYEAQLPKWTPEHPLLFPLLTESKDGLKCDLVQKP